MKHLFLKIFFMSLFFGFVFGEQYQNTTYGFSIQPPSFVADLNASSVNVASFFGNPGDIFSANLGVIIQQGFSSLEGYVALSEKQFTEMNVHFSSTPTSVSGIPAMMWEYDNYPDAEDLKFIAVMVLHQNLVYLLTGASLKKDFETNKPIFLASFKSFSFIEEATSKTVPNIDISAQKKDIYQNDTYKFTLVPPKFPRETRLDVNTTLAQFFAAVDENFSANMNIIFQKTSLPVEEYLTVSEKEFEEMGLKIVSKTRSTISNYPAMTYETTGTFSSFSLTFLATLIFKEGECLMVTCTGTSSNFENYRSIFQATLQSIQWQ